MAITRASLTYVSLWKMLTKGTGNKKTFASRYDIIPLFEGHTAAEAVPLLTDSRQPAGLLLSYIFMICFLQSFLAHQWIRVRFYWSNYNIKNLGWILDVPAGIHNLHSQASIYSPIEYVYGFVVLCSLWVYYQIIQLIYLPITNRFASRVLVQLLQCQ